MAEKKKPARSAAKIAAEKKNLVKFNEENAAEMGRRGGLAAAARIRQRKSLREAADFLLGLPLRGGEDIAELASLADAKATRNANGTMTTPNITVEQAVVLAQIKEAMNGSTSAANFIAEILGEKTQKVELSRNIDEAVKEMEAYFEKRRAGENNE